MKHLDVKRTDYQVFPSHLVDPSPWPILTSFALFTFTVSAVLYMHGFTNGGTLLTLGLLLTAGAMTLWFRDVVTESTLNLLIVYQNLICRIRYIVIPKEIINKTYQLFVKENNYLTFDSKSLGFNDQLGYYLAGLIEGDGYISLPAIGKTKLNRIINPSIVFTSHINNIGMYTYLQSKLVNIGRFQRTGINVLRYIIGDIEGIKLIIQLVHGKFRTPKNIRFNQLIKFMNEKYNLNIPDSPLDESNILNNSWLTGFVEADGHFGLKIVKALPKSKNRKRSRSYSIKILFQLDQRAHDVPTNSSMYPVMELISKYLNCNLNIFESKSLNTKGRSKTILSISITSPEKLKILIKYFIEYPLLGNKYKDYKDWEKIYYMIVSKEHLTESGRLKIESIRSNMNSLRKFNDKISNLYNS